MPLLIYQILKKWQDQNLLTLNVSKPKFLPISLRSTNTSDDLNLSLLISDNFYLKCSNNNCSFNVIIVHKFKYILCLYRY